MIWKSDGLLDRSSYVYIPCTQNSYLVDVYKVLILMNTFGLLHQYKCLTFCLGPYVVYVTGFMKICLVCTTLYIYIRF